MAIILISVDVHSYAQRGWTCPQGCIVSTAGAAPWEALARREKVAFVRQVMAQKGYNKPVFVGEVALKCTDGTAECYDAAAAFVPRVYAELIVSGVAGQVYYLLIEQQCVLFIDDFRFYGAAHV